jgi:hypothetical protein
VRECEAEGGRESQGPRGVRGREGVRGRGREEVTMVGRECGESRGGREIVFAFNLIIDGSCCWLWELIILVSWW